MEMTVEPVSGLKNTVCIRTGTEDTDRPPRVSAVIITCNEEKNLIRTLPKLGWCDEIIIVDSGSTDATLAICRQFGCKIYTRKFDGYGDQKRFAVSKASNDWVLCIDADEILTNKLIQEIKEVLRNNNGKYAGFAIRMNLVFLDKEFKYGKESGRFYLRLFNRQRGGFTDDKVHEGILISGPVLKLRSIINHYSYTSLHQFMEKLNRYSNYSAEMAFSRGKNKSLFAVLFGLPFNFFKYYLLERNFLNGIKGFYWSALSSYYHFVKYVKLRELNRVNPNEN